MIKIRRVVTVTRTAHSILLMFYNASECPLPWLVYNRGYWGQALVSPFDPPTVSWYDLSSALLTFLHTEHIVIVWGLC